MTDWVKLTQFGSAVLGTSLRGYIDISYDQLVEVFGEPSSDGDSYGDKIDAAWYLMFADGTAATIYNYKDGKNYQGASGLETKDITDWHIGGHNDRAVALVTEALSS